MFDTDKQAKNLTESHSCSNLREVLNSGVIRCPHTGCDDPHTHVVDVVWETDPAEGDRRRVRLEVRCENGHGFLFLISNHGGQSRLVHHLLNDVYSPFAEGARW